MASERLPSILKAVNERVSGMDNPRATLDVPGLTEDEANVVAETYSGKYRIVGPTREGSDYAVHIGFGGIVNA